MLADLFYLSAIWLVLGFALALLLGTVLRFGNFFWSLLYLGSLIVFGDLIALDWLGEPLGLTLLASLIVFCAGMPLLLLLRDWNAPGQVFFLFSLTTTVVYLGYAFMVTAVSPTSALAFLFSFLLFILEMAALTLSLSYAFEVLDVLCRIRWRRKAVPRSLGAYVPMVSLHVPAYNEPPELVEKTLRALARLDYPSYEVILIDNNTPEEAVWQPLANVCKELGFKCLHLDRWPGYKSGALNFALAMTDPQAEIIGVIDADYIVRPDYLRRIVPYFEEPGLAFVQTPQDYRDYQENSFFQAVYDGYKYFFALSMPCRNERNAIIFCGTMGLLRKKVLQEIGGWDEWCITEDAEASLRILNLGYDSLYVDETFGRGLMPLDFEGLKKQRFRWAFGGVQILKKHWARLMPWAHWVDPANRLSAGQRYFYLMAGLQWFNELFTFAFTVMVLISAALTATDHTSFLRPATMAFIVLPIVLINTNLLRALWGLRYALSLSWLRASRALGLWLSLTWVGGLACIQALARKRGVFLRTPKALTDSAWIQALQASSWETMLGVTCILAGLVAFIHSPTFLTLGLLVLCWSQAIIYLSAPVQSLLGLTSTRRQPAGHPDRANISGSVANEGRLGMQVGLAVASLIIFAFAASLWPVSDRLPSWYAFYNPQPLIVPQAQPPLQLLPTPAPLPTEQPTVPAPTVTATAPLSSATPRPPASDTPAPRSRTDTAPPPTHTVSPPPASDTPAPPSPTDTAPPPSDVPSPTP